MTYDSDCAGCPIDPERRALLRAAAVVLASLGLLGVMPRNVGAATHGRRDEKRYPMLHTDGVSIDKDNGVIVARAGGKAYAFSLACPHQNTALRWKPDDRQFQCPKHKSRYRDDGAFIEGRATRAMDRLAVRRDGDILVVDVDTLYQQDEQPTEWQAAFVVV